MRRIFNLLPDSLASHHRVLGAIIVPTSAWAGLSGVEIHPFGALRYEYTIIGVIVAGTITIDARAVVGRHARDRNRVKLEHPVGVVVIFALDHLYSSRCQVRLAE